MLNDIQTANTESLKGLIENIDGKNIILPEFQREFVWEVSKTYDLFDSLVRGVFIGSLIYGVPSFEITVREIDCRPRKQKGKRRHGLKKEHYTKEQINAKVKTTNFHLILDGQQRITSIYRALTEADSVWFVTKNDDELDDEASSRGINRQNLEELLFEISGQENPDRLSVKIADVWSIIEGKIKREDHKRECFENTRFGKRVSQDSKRSDELFDKFLGILNKLEDLFKAEKLISYYLLDTTQEKFALFFERSNSRGIQLNFVDILTAKLYGGFNLRDKTVEFEDIHRFTLLNLQIVVRCIAYIVSQHRQIARSYILQNLTAKDFNEHWEIICELYQKCLDWLYKNHFILSQSWMPYENMLIPLIMFLREFPGYDFSQMNERQNEFLRYWYWGSIFSQRYSGSSNEVILEDTGKLIKIANDGHTTDRTYCDKLRIQINSKEEILSLNNKGSSLYRGILNLVNFGEGGLIDWQNTNRLSFNSNLEAHHIFPDSFLRSKYRDNEEVIEHIDSVANRTLIPKLTNIKIGKKAPSKYLSDLKKANPKLVKNLFEKSFDTISHQVNGSNVHHCQLAELNGEPPLDGTHKSRLPKR